MELIIIGTLTTIALLTMQAAEFLATRHWLAPAKLPAVATAESSAADSEPLPARRLHVEDETLEQAA